MTFKPSYCSDRWQGLLAILGLLGLDTMFLRIVLTREIDGASFCLGLFVLLSLPVLGYIGYRTAGALNLEYWVDRDGVTIIWGPMRRIVPMGQIERIQRGGVAAAGDRPRQWHWPCPNCRTAVEEKLGPVSSHATEPLPGQLILVTANGNYGLSPADPERFLAALQARYALGVARPRQATVERSPLWTWALWRDRRALVLIGLGLLGAIFMFGVLSFRYPALSADLPLHFDVNGLPDRIAPKSGLLFLPGIGLLAWAVNLGVGVWIYRQVQRQGAYLLWAGAIAVQAVATLALFNLMRW